MTTIIYKKILGRYEIIKIDERGGENMRIEFEDPIDASLIISDTPHPVVRGVCDVKCREILDGFITPKLYTGGNMQTLEGFTVKLGAVIKNPADDEYVRRLSEVADGLLLRICRLEAALCEIENKIERKITF